MVLERDMEQELSEFLESWEDTTTQTKKAFGQLKNHLAAKSGVEFSFKARSGISYSLRARHLHQTHRELFVIMDVIDDPGIRWLSVCFYPDMISDPEEMGNLIPLGLLGEDGYCFDLEEWEEEYLSYLVVRIDEAYQRASRIEF
jgi:hypothetical protein